MKGIVEPHGGSIASQGELAEAQAYCIAREAMEIAAGTDWFELTGVAWLDLARMLRVAGSADARRAVRPLARFAQSGNVVGEAMEIAAGTDRFEPCA